MAKTKPAPKTETPAPDAKSVRVLLATYILAQLYKNKKASYDCFAYIKNHRLLYLTWLAYVASAANFQIPNNNPLSTFEFYRCDKGPILEISNQDVIDIHENLAKKKNLTPAYNYAKQNLSSAELLRLNQAVELVRREFVKYDTYLLNAITCETLVLTGRSACFTSLDLSQKNITDECRAFQELIKPEKTH